MLVAEHAGKLNAGESPDAPDAARRLALRVSSAEVFMTAKASAIGSCSSAKASLGIGEDGGPKSSNWQVLAQPGFRWYFAGSVVSNFGTWLQNTAQVVLAYQLTHSVFWVGVVTCAQFTSPLLLGPWAGVATQWFGNWRTLIATQGASLLISASLAILQVSGALTRTWLIAGAVGIGLAYTFALPALSVTVAALVPPTEIKRALAMDSVSYNLGRALAPVLSVIVFMNVGFGLAFALNAVSFGFFTGVLLWLGPSQTGASANRSRVMNGIRIAYRDRRIMVLLLMVAAVTVAADPILVLGPSLARSFHHSADLSGVFITALGAGNVIGSLRRSRQEASIRHAASALCILSVAMIVVVMAHWILLSVIAAATAGVACLLAGATLRTLLLRHAGGAERQAAVMAAWALAWAGSKPIASFADGALAGSPLGMRSTAILLALPALVPAFVLVGFPKAGKRLVRHMAFR
jgi:predicted MFS family arabinose efflux permease